MGLYGKTYFNKKEIITENYINENGETIVITEEVIVEKKEAKEYIIKKINQFIKEKNAKGFKASTAIAPINVFCTDDKFNKLIVTGSTKATKIIAGALIAGGVGAITALINPALTPAVGAASMAAGNAVADMDNLKFFEFVKQNKSELEKYINDGWNHSVKIVECIKKDKLFPNRIVFEYDR